MPTLLPEMHLSQRPDRIVALVEEGEDTDLLAERAIELAQEVMPKVTGYLTTTLRPIMGPNYFGIYFPDRRVWFLDQGTRPFTMHQLAGKTIPMWIDDPTGAERRKNPKAKTRRTIDGRLQVLIFRRVGTREGAQARKASKVVKLLSSGARVARYSYPGAAGRIARREAKKPMTSPGRTGGRIAKGNVGVAWRHPGLTGRQFLNFAVMASAEESGLDLPHVYLTDGATFFPLVRS